jgi:cyclophilin family peptidyl-prolyl cis-trans isomerase
VPTNKQRRQAAQRHLQRQLERRAEQTRRRRRNLLIGVTTIAVLAVAAAVVVIAGIGTGKPDPAAAGASSAAPSSGAAASSAAVTTSPAGLVSCNWTKDTTGNTNLKDVGLPPNPVPTQGTDVLKMATSQGDLTLTLDRTNAPCASASFTYLAQKNFFANSPCHREVNQPTFGVLQCGDPTGTGSGGPTYDFRQEVTAKTTYPRGTIAMANTGSPNSTGSQFFLCFTDTQLSPDYTAVGTVDQAGLAVLDKVAAAGNDGSFDPSPGGGKPKLPVTISAVSVVSS